MGRRIEHNVLRGLFHMSVLIASTSLVTGVRAADTTVIPKHTAASQPTAVRSSPKACAPECGLPGTGALSTVRLKSTVMPSFPGSGSTWFRHLLTTATGILTGVVYSSDIGVTTLGNQTYRVIGTKTHDNPEYARMDIPYERVLLLIRNPYDALVAKFNRGGDTPAKFDKFVLTRPREDFVKVWPKFASKAFRIWMEKHLLWAKETVPVHVLIYDRLVANTGQELHDVLNFLNESSIVPRIHCAMTNNEGVAHRHKPLWLQEMNLYSEEMKAEINSGINRVHEALAMKTGKSFQEIQQWKK